MKTQKTMKLSKGIEVLCKDDAGVLPYTCASQTEAEEKVTTLGVGWTVYQGTGPEFYIARKKGVAKHEKLIIAKLSNGVEVLAVSGGKSVGAPRSWGGTTGRSNAERNAKALGLGWTVYKGEGPEFYVAPAKQFKEGGAVNMIDDKGPHLVLITGCVGAGKTTMRRQQYAKGYVNIDAAEIFAMFTGGKYYDFPGIFENEMNRVGIMVARQAVYERRNIVMEIIGSDGIMESIIKGVSSIGYFTDISCISCPLDECLKSHKHACETDVNYVSAYYTQSFHQR